MSCESASRNATPPAPAIAPGAEAIDARQVAAAIGSGAWAWPGAGATNTAGACVDPRVPALVARFDAPFFQAGLAGYSDAAMRIIARRHGCPFCVTEALLDRTMLAGGRGFDKADLGELRDNIPGGPEDQPLACQIMGSNPGEMAAAAVKAIEQRRRSDKAYRMLALRGESDALRGEGFPPARTLAPTPIRLPGGEQLGVYDPTEGLGDDAGADGGDWSCAVDEPELDGEPPGSGNASDDPDASTPSSLRHSVAPSRSSFAAIDVNLACPVKKIEKKSRGGHWLTEPRGAIALLEAVRDATPAHIPCTVKLRRSFDDTPEMVDNFHAIFAAAYDMGYAWATVHARTVEQKYVGPSRWTFLRDLRELHPDKIILGSGDTWSVVDIFRMIAYAGMSGVSVARGCIGNPWIFRQARDMMAGSAPRVPTIPEQRAVLAEHFRLSLAVTRRFRHAEQATSMMMRKFAIRFAMHHARSDEVRKRFIAVQSAAQWQQVLDEFYRD